MKLTPEEVFFDSRETQLANAARKGDVKNIAELIHQGANINAKGLHDLSVLSLALYKENLEGVKALLANGANPNAYATDGWAPIHFACSLIKDERFLSEILQAGGDPNLIIKQGAFSGRPLHEVMLHDNRAMEKVKLLLAAGADINGLNSTGQTAMMSAVTANQFDVVSFLIDAGADTQIKDAYGNSLAIYVERVLEMPGASRHKAQLKWQKVVQTKLGLAP